MHESITAERVIEICEEDDNIGICKNCGEERECTEPDARNYPCKACGANDVFGTEDLLLSLS